MALRARYRFRMVPSRILLFILPLLSLCTSQPYQHLPKGIIYHSDSCAINWCGENWKANRILHYIYITSSVQRNISVAEFRKNCTNAASSLDCSEAVVDPTSTHSIREEIVNRTLVNQTKNAAVLRNPGAIFTDNINIFGQQINSTYATNADKVWQIKIPKGCRLTLQFDKFDVETSDSCEKDYFSVQTSKQEDYRKYCNSLHRIEIQSRRRVQLIFHSDASVAKSGIYARMCFSERENDIACSCGAAVTTERRRRSLDEHNLIQFPRKAATVHSLRGSHTLPAPDKERQLQSVDRDEPILKHFQNSKDPILRILSQSYDSENDKSSSRKAVDQLRQ